MLVFVVVVMFEGQTASRELLSDYSSRVGLAMQSGSCAMVDLWNCSSADAPMSALWGTEPMGMSSLSCVYHYMYMYIYTAAMFWKADCLIRSCPA
jgi:hypothetical protein